jgi:hypothetical protein
VLFVDAPRTVIVEIVDIVVDLVRQLRQRDLTPSRWLAVPLATPVIEWISTRKRGG